MSFVIASQMEEGFNEALRAHPSRPAVIGVREDEPWSAATDADVVLVRPSPTWRSAKTAPRPPCWPGRLKWVYSASAGVDPYPPWLLEAPTVTCGRGVSSEEIGDYVLAAIFLRAKDLEAHRAHSPDQWKNAPLGRIDGATVGIFGLGAIGAAVARRALALGMRVTAVRRRAHLSSPIEGVELLADVGAVAASADHLVLALPSTAATRQLINADVLARAKSTGHLINVGRGSVLDHAALVDALDGDRLAFATLDVTDPEPLPAGHPLWTHPRVRLTPHISSNHTQVRDIMVRQVTTNLDLFVRGVALNDVVDRVAGY